jgi:hypothetical protein
MIQASADLSGRSGVAGYTRDAVPLSPAADMPSHSSGRLCANSGREQMQQKASLLDKLIGAGEQNQNQPAWRS